MSFNSWIKKFLFFYGFTISELNITIKITPEAAEPLPFFAGYIESWRVTWKTTFFKFFKSNDNIMKNNIFDKQSGGLQIMMRVVYTCI